jgi:hypothetical protein
MIKYRTMYGTVFGWRAWNEPVICQVVTRNSRKIDGGTKVIGRPSDIDRLVSARSLSVWLDLNHGEKLRSPWWQGSLVDRRYFVEIISSSWSSRPPREKW